MSSRIERVVAHLSASPVAALGAGPDNDVVLVSSVRTPLCRAKRGALAQTSAVVMLRTALEGAVARAGIDPSIVDDICVGTVLAPGSERASEVKMASFLAGFPDTTSVRTVNRQCSSGLQAIADIAAAIQAGHIQVWPELQT